VVKAHVDCDSVVDEVIDDAAPKSFKQFFDSPSGIAATRKHYLHSIKILI
jgi:hypothetical protein